MTPASRARTESRAHRPPRASSRANGTKFGRRTMVDDPANVATARRMKADGQTARDVAKYLGVSRATLYRYLGDDAA
jgi:DNA invertase Pin-like site-specific DNA recombinase